MSLKFSVYLSHKSATVNAGQVVKKTINPAQKLHEFRIATNNLESGNFKGNKVLKLEEAALKPFPLHSAMAESPTSFGIGFLHDSQSSGNQFIANQLLSI
jgi:hypothetical protein